MLASFLLLLQLVSCVSAMTFHKRLLRGVNRRGHDGSSVTNQQM